MLYRVHIFLIALCIVFLQGMPAFAKMLDGHTILRASDANICALTFDDGPSHLSGKILDELQAENVKATFFVLGSQVLQYPRFVQRMKDEGHEVANHSFNHADLSKLSAEGSYADMQKVNEILDEFGIEPRYFRPPYGKHNKKVVAMAAKLGMDTVLWSTDSRDWSSQPDYANMENIFGRPFSTEEMRGIFLFHETKKRTARDIRLIITILRAVGCEHFVTVSEYFDTVSLPHMSPDSDLPPKMTARPDIITQPNTSINVASVTTEAKDDRQAQNADTPIRQTRSELVTQENPPLGYKPDPFAYVKSQKSLVAVQKSTVQGKITSKTMASVHKPDPFCYSSIKHVPQHTQVSKVSEQSSSESAGGSEVMPKDVPPLLRMPLENSARDDTISSSLTLMGSENDVF